MEVLYWLKFSPESGGISVLVKNDSIYSGLILNSNK